MSRPLQPVAPCSLLICSRNRRDLLRDTVRSIAAGDLLPEELVIVDQSDEPDPDLAHLLARTGPRASFAGRVGGPEDTRVRYIHSETVGRSRAMNIALAAASHDHLVSTDDDVRVQPDWLRTILSALIEGGPGQVVTGRVLPEPGDPGTFVPSTIERIDAIVYDRPQANYDPLFPLNMAMHRTVPERVGGFDERIGPGTAFPAAEDNEFAYRILRAGIRIRYVPEAVLYHRAWRDLDGFAAFRWGYGRGQGAFLAKHASLRNPYGWVRLWRALYRPLLRFPIRFARVRSRALAEFAYTGGILSGFAEWKLARLRGGAPVGTEDSAGRAGQSGPNGSTE